MASSDAEKIIQKIKKLLAMAEHEASNVNEASRAASMAAKMMNEYQISHADVIRAELKTNNGVQKSPISEMEYSAWPRWLQRLAVQTAKLFECEVKFDRIDGGRRKRIVLFGYQTDILMVQWMYEYLYDELIRLAAVEVNKNTSNAHAQHIKASFLSGAVAALHKRFEEIIEEKKQAHAASGSDLMVVKKAAIESKYGVTTYVSHAARATDEDAYEAGLKAGRKVNINRPLGASAETREISN